MYTVTVCPQPVETAATPRQCNGSSDWPNLSVAPPPNPLPLNPPDSLRVVMTDLSLITLKQGDWGREGHNTLRLIMSDHRWPPMTSDDRWAGHPPALPPGPVVSYIVLCPRLNHWDITQATVIIRRIYSCMCIHSDRHTYNNYSY